MQPLATSKERVTSPFRIDDLECGEIGTHPDLSRFSIQEKLSWLAGADLWNLKSIPGADSVGVDGTISICLSDGPHGLRKPLSALTLQEAHPATCFPSACATACTWNVGLMKRMGQALALECDHYDVQVLLGPGINIKRNPAGGRNHEYFSEDPLLTGLLAKGYIAGVQDSGSVAACVKHFCANNQESYRMVIDVEVDERTLRELYLPAFEMAICCEDSVNGDRTVPKLLMAAYNKVNGEYCCENKHLLQNILRNEWKFQGVVVSDWGAVNDRLKSLNVGMDLEMPGNLKKGAFDNEVLKAVRESEEESREEIETAIDDCAVRVSSLISELENTQGQKVKNTGNVLHENDRLARMIARESIVLLQNKENLLPLSKSSCVDGKKIGLIGDFGRHSPRYQGMGSAHVTATNVTSVFSAMQHFLHGDDENDIESQYQRTFSEFHIPFARGYDADTEGDEIDHHLIDEAVHLAQQKDVGVVVVCVGLPEIMESEGFDRHHMRLPKQHIALVEAVARVHRNVVVILSHGGIVEIPQSFVEGAKSILEGFLLGQAGGRALVDVLFGEVSPSGKLPETIPIRWEDIPSSAFFPGTKEKVTYGERLSVGYRHFDTANVPVRYPFGHGLQYTHFHYDNLRVKIQQDDVMSKRVVVTIEVKNVGILNNSSPLFSNSVMEVVQLYIRPINSKVYRPFHELKQFAKVELSLGETRKVEFSLNQRSFAFYDVGFQDWVVENFGEFEIEIGASSRDIRLRQRIKFETGRDPSIQALASYALSPYTDDSALVLSGSPTNDYESSESDSSNATNNDTLIPRSSSSVKNDQSGGRSIISRNTMLVDAAKVSVIARIILFVSLKVAAKEVKNGPTKKRELRMIRANVESLPLRGLVIFSQGNFSFQLLDFLILLMNGKYFKALKNAVSRGS